MDSTKPVCKYGSSCYRKNPDHLKQFSHPERDEVKGKTSRTRGGKRNKRTADSQQGKTITEFFSVESNDPSSASSSLDPDPSPEKRFKSDNTSAPINLPANEQKDPVSSTSSEYQVEAESDDVGENIKRKFLVEMPTDFYNFWEFCKSINPSQPEAALKPTLGLELVGPYHVLAGRLTGVPWEKCVLHYRYYFDPPEFQTVLTKISPNPDGFHIGYFRDDPKSTECLVVSNSAKKGCEISIEGSSLFGVVRNQLDVALQQKELPPHKKHNFQELHSKLTSFIQTMGTESAYVVKDLWKRRRKETVATCFHKIGIVVPYDKNTELGYRPLTMSDRDLKKLLDRIAGCKDESKRDQLFEQLQEIVTYVQFANDECDYGMGLELGLDLFCHGDKYYHTLVGHLLPIAYELLGREPFGKICSEHLQQRAQDPLDVTT